MHRPRRFARVLAPSLLPLLSLSLCLAASPAAAAAPEVKFPVTFTTTLTPGTVYPFTFSIWDMKTGGTQVADWVEGPVKLAVASNKTVYFVLGSKVALPALDFSQQYWVQIATGLKKYRTRLPAAGYSFWSQSVDTTALDARYVEEGQAGTVTETMIADGQVTAPKVASGAADAGTVLTADGSGGARWQALSDVPPAAHQHAGEDVASGTVGAARVDAAIARDSEIVPAVLAADGTGSTLDADLLDGKHGSSYVSLPYAGSGGTSGALFSVTNELSDAFTEPVAVKGVAHDYGSCGIVNCPSTGGWFEGTTGIYAKARLGWPGYAGYFEGSVETTGIMSFGSTTRQMLDLWDNDYGIGVQASYLYARTGGGFVLYKGGVHDDAGGPGTGGSTLMWVDPSGNLFTAGAVNPPSDRNVKEAFAPVEPAAVLAKVAALPIQSWKYKADEQGIRHLGPVAQDFHAAFGLGANDTSIATVDADGVALAAIQGLNEVVEEQRARMDAQEATLKAQADEVAALRTQLAAQSLLVERLLAATGRGGESTATR